MASDLSWNLHGNDQLSGVLEKLDRTLNNLSRRLDGVTSDAKQAGRALDGVEDAANHAGRGLDGMATKSQRLAAHLSTVKARAREMATDVRGHLGSVSTFVGSLGSRFMQLGQLAAVGFGIAAAAAGAWALKTAADNETAAISFEVLFGNVEKAQAFLKKLHAFAAATPFEMPELRESASRLLAVGVSADRIIPLLTRLGDATAAMGTGAFGIQRAVYALQQMSQAGKVSLEDINQLTDAGIPALDALSAKLGTTVSKLREQISAGKIKPEQLFEAILQGAGKTFPRLQGMMVRQSATLAGIWSTFKDNTSQSLAKFAEPMIPGIKRAIDWTSTNLPKALSWIREQGAKAGDFLGTKTPIKGEWMAALRKLGQEVLPVLRDAWKDLQTWVSQNHDKLERISRFITEFLIPSFGTWLVGAIRATVGAIKLAITVTDEVITAFKWMTRQVLGFLKNLLDAAVINFGWIPGLGPKLKEAQKKFKEFADGILTQLDRVDGKVVDVYVRAHGDLEFTEGNRNERRGGHRAAGGPVWRGEAYTINEMGVESYYAAATGVIESNEKLRNRMSGIGSSNEVIGVLEVVHKTPDGNVLWTELKALKRRKNLSSLGL